MSSALTKIEIKDMVHKFKLQIHETTFQNTEVCLSMLKSVFWSLALRNLIVEKHRWKKTIHSLPLYLMAVQIFNAY